MFPDMALYIQIKVMNLTMKYMYVYQAFLIYIISTVSNAG